MQSQETELQGQLQNLYQENARINYLVNQIQITGDSMNILEIRDWRSNCRRQTEVSHL